MSYAVYNPTTNRIRTWVNLASGTVPEGWEFRSSAEVPRDAVMEVTATEPVPVPQEVARWALREICEDLGHAEAIELAFSKLPADIQRKARGRWDSKDTISRGSSMITALQALLGWSNDYVDELFIAADTLARS